jgi:hypothetical protein
VAQLKGIDVLISCITWEHLHPQIPWIEAAKEAGVKRFVPSEWVSPAPKGVIDIKDKVRSKPLPQTLEAGKQAPPVLTHRAETRRSRRHSPRSPAVHRHRRGLLVPGLCSQSPIWKG